LSELCSKCAPRTRTQRLDDDTTENVKPRLWLKREAAFAASWEYVTVPGLKGLKSGVVC